MRNYSAQILVEARTAAAPARGRELRFACVGNLANYLYIRAAPLRRRGIDIDVVLHPHDTFMMSQPGWEEFDGELVGADSDVTLPEVDGVIRVQPVEVSPEGAVGRNTFLRQEDAEFVPFLAYEPLLQHLQRYDALLATQALYLAYLARRPYLAAQGGGDLWIECSRGDALGLLQRRGFGGANAILASNPWTFAHARRFGFVNAIYLPFMLDDEVYAPGEPVERDDWRLRTGGSFFVLCSSRLDDRYKGSALALDGFRRFAAQHPEARLVLLSWGEDEERNHDRLRSWGIDELTLILPIAGKRRLVSHLRSAHCLLDQFALGAYGATALEAMGCGLPVVMRLELDQYDALCEHGAPPVLNAADPDVVAAALSLLARDEDERRRRAEAARTWFVASHGASSWADAYVDVLTATALGHRFSYRRSPLASRLTRAEREYHAAGLTEAPPFA